MAQRFRIINFLQALVFLTALRLGFCDFISSSDIQRVKKAIERATHERNLPDNVQKWIAVLQKHMYILNCLPTQKRGSCYISPRYCSIPSLKFDGKQLRAQFSLCKNPWKIIVNFELPKLPWYVRVKYDPIIIPIDHRKDEGITKIHSVSTAKASVLGIVNVYKGSLIIDAIVRWDCSKPTDNKSKRVRYNRLYGNRNYYKLKVRIEVKKKKFPCFCYRCKRCENVVDKRGVIGSKVCKREFIGYPRPYPGRPCRHRYPTRCRWAQIPSNAITSVEQ